MKKTLIKTIIYSLGAISLSSCYTDFDPKIESDPVLCMNSIIETGCPIKVELSRTWVWTEKDFPHYIYVRDATVELYINGELKDTMEFTEYGPQNPYGNPDIGYFSDVCPRAGDEVRLVAVSKELGEAEATVVMPQEVPIEKVDVETTSVDETEASYATFFRINQYFSVWFTDPASDVNYYRLLMKPVNPEPVGTDIFYEDYDGTMRERIYASQLTFDRISHDNEPLFSEHESVLDVIFGSSSTWFSLFSDRSISGQSYPLQLEMERGSLITYNPEEIESLYDVRLRFTLYNVSASYYNWFIYDWYRNESIQGALGDAGLAETIIPCSNVSTKAGIVAACTPSAFEISYRDFLKENYKPDHSGNNN